MTTPNTESEPPRPSRATCVCCRNLGVLPTTPGPQTYAVPNEAGEIELVEVANPQTVPGGVVQQMCDECVIAAFLSGGRKPHPHRIARSLRNRGVKGNG